MNAFKQYNKWISVNLPLSLFSLHVKMSVVYYIDWDPELQGLETLGQREY